MMSEIKLALLTVASNRQHPGHQRLIRSCQRHGWDLRYAGEPGAWLGVGTKLTLVQEILPRLTIEGYTHVLFTDGNDTIAVGGPEEFIGTYKTLFGDTSFAMSTEIVCWPDEHLKWMYPVYKNSKWEYLNSGNYIAPIWLLEKSLQGCDTTQDDQRFFTAKYLNHSIPIMRDDICSLFQSTAGCPIKPGNLTPDEFHFELDRNFDERPVNSVTGNKPIFWHGNGGDPKQLDWIGYN